MLGSNELKAPQQAFIKYQSWCSLFTNEFKSTGFNQQTVDGRKLLTEKHISDFTEGLEQAS